MSDEIVSGWVGDRQARGNSTDRGQTAAHDRGVIAQILAGLVRLVPVPAKVVTPLLVAGTLLGIIGDVLLRAPGAIALNASIWIAAVVVAAVALHRVSGARLDTGRLAWLAVGAVFAWGLMWRDAAPLKLLALGAATLAFALAAHRPTTAWIRHAGILRYAGAVAFGALHAWAAAALTLVDATLGARRTATAPDRWRRFAAVTRGLLIATPLVVVFGALFSAADAVFADVVLGIVQFDVEPIVRHAVLFGICAWLATGYLRGFLSGTEPPLLGMFLGDGEGTLPIRRPTLGITEVGTVLGALALLFLLFVIVQFRYLFGGDDLVQVTPNLTYAEYARRGFFELVAATALVVPVLLVADWLVDRRNPRDTRVFRALAGVQVALVLAVTASALQRLRLYYEGYGLTDTRLYAVVFLLWTGTMLVWFAATALRGRRQSFAFGTLISGLVAVLALFVLNPDGTAVRTNLSRITTGHAAAPFDVAYASSLSADAVPLLLVALPSLPADAQCRLAQQILRRWSPDRARSLRTWNWSAWQAGDLVRDNERWLRAMAGPNQECPAPPGS